MIPPRLPRTFRKPEPLAKPFLYPRGTTLAEIPPLARGLTEMEYLDYCIAQSKKEAAMADSVPADAPAPKPVETPVFGSRRRRA
jgi:hypothetical protein